MMPGQDKQIFLTGASGYIGSVVAEYALEQGYKVHALSRTEASDTKIQSIGAVPIRGDLTSLDILRHESAEADVVIHLATAYQFGRGTYDDVLPIDIAAINAMADSLTGSDKALIVAGGTLAVAPDPAGVETTEASPPELNPINTRFKFERHALSLASRGIRVTSVRLAPFVYGRGGSGVNLFMKMAAQAGKVTIVDGGKHHTTVVHVDDAARLILLVAGNSNAQGIFNASGATDVTGRQLFGAMAAVLGVPTNDIPFQIAKEQLGDTVARFLSADNRASGAKARKELGWRSDGMGILDEIHKGSYQALAKQLRRSDS